MEANDVQNENEKLFSFSFQIYVPVCCVTEQKTSLDLQTKKSENT